MDALLARIERAGWGWSVDRYRPGISCTAYVHVPSEEGRSTCFHAEGRTPEIALNNAQAKAVHAGIAEREAA